MIGGAASLVAFIPAGVGVSEVSVISVLSLFGYQFTLTAAGAILADLFLTSTLLVSGALGSVFIRKEERNV